MRVDRVSGVARAQTWTVAMDMPTPQERIDRVNLADASTAHRSRRASRLRVDDEGTAAHAEERSRIAAEQKAQEEHRLDVRDAREAAQRRKSFDLDV